MFANTMAQVYIQHGTMLEFSFITTRTLGTEWGIAIIKHSENPKQATYNIFCLRCTKVCFSQEVFFPYTLSLELSVVQPSGFMVRVIFFRILRQQNCRTAVAIWWSFFRIMEGSYVPNEEKFSYFLRLYTEINQVSDGLRVWWEFGVNRGRASDRLRSINATNRTDGIEHVLCIWKQMR